LFCADGRTAQERWLNLLPTHQKFLEDQMGRNVFTYVDDKVVASKNKDDHLSDLTETFANMREARLWLNPKKCIFGVR
jgi:hypothetical protein